MGSDLLRTARNAFIALSIFAFCAGASFSAKALTINTSFDFGNAPGSVFGEGDFENVFNTAASIWENALLDANRTESISFGWDILGGSTLAVASVGSSNRITFDNDGSSNWFLDSSPFDNSEWSNFSESSADLGGGIINTGRVFSGATGAAASDRADLLTVALHEIGHVLGLIGNLSDPLAITAPLPSAGTELDLNGGHLNLANSVMFNSITLGHRRLLSTADILGVAQAGGYSLVNLDPSPVPLPGALLLMGSGLIGLLRYRRRSSVSVDLPAAS